MSTVLQTLSITELYKRKEDLLQQLKRVNNEIEKRELIEKIDTNIIQINESGTIPRTCKIKIKIKKISNNLA